MKKLLFIFLLISLCSHRLNSQDHIKIYLGYNGGFPTSSDDLDFVIDRYNETRIWLGDPMDPFDYMGGFTFKMAEFYSDIFLEIGYNRMKHTSEAKGDPDGSGETQRDVRFTMTGIEFALGPYLGEPDKPVMLGFMSEVGGMNMKTRVGTPDDIRKEKWSKVDTNLLIDFGLFLRAHLGNPGVALEAFYKTAPVDIFAIDMDDVNEGINPATYLDDPTELIYKPSHFGFSVMFAIGSKD